MWRLRPLLFLAAPDATSVSALAAKTGEYGYRCWRMETSLFQPSNFNCRETDIFSGHSAFALLAIPEEIDVDVDFPGCVELTVVPNPPEDSAMSPMEISRIPEAGLTLDTSKPGLLDRMKKLLS